MGSTWQPIGQSPTRPEHEPQPNPTQSCRDFTKPDTEHRKAQYPMAEARRLRGHKATATCCIASRDRPGLVATSGEVSFFLSYFIFLLFGCPEAAGTGKIIETLYWLCYCDHFMKIGWLHLLVWYAMQRCGAYNGFGSESNFIFVFQARWVWFNYWIASLILYWFQDA